MATAGELGGAPFFKALQIDNFQHLQHTAVNLLLGQLDLVSRGVRLGDAKSEGDVLVHVQMGEQGVFLENRVHLPLVGREIRNIFIVKKHIPRVRPDEPGDGAQDRGLAAARGAQEGDELPIVYLQVEATQHLLPVVGDGDVF